MHNALRRPLYRTAVDRVETREQESEKERASVGAKARANASRPDERARVRKRALQRLQPLETPRDRPEGREIASQSLQFTARRAEASATGG